MKKFILGFALLTSSLVAQASYTCNVKTLKPTLPGLAIITTNDNLLFEDSNNTTYTLESHRLGSIQDDSYRFAFWLSAQVKCSSEGSCELRGIIHDSYLKVQKNGSETYVNSSYGGREVSVLGRGSQDIVVTEAGKKLLFRIKCY